jgi:hypothetical protein
MKVIMQWFNKKCDNNNKRRSIFEGTTLHNLNKGCRQSYSSLPSTISQQIIKCSICIQKNKFLSFPLHHFIFFQFTHKNIKLNLMFIL